MDSWTSAMPPLPAEEWRQVLAEHEVAVVHFLAVWSVPDRMLNKVLEQVRPEFEHIAFFSCDVDSDSAVEVFAANGVMTTPTFCFFLKGQQRALLIGCPNADQLRAKLREWLAAST